MRKKLFVVAAALFFIFILSSGVAAQLEMLSGADLLMSDWQLDYIRPLEPGELKKGEYRFTPIIGRFDIQSKEKDFFNSRNNYNDDYDSMLYLMAFDTAVTDNLLFHGKYLYKPWGEYDDGEENKINFVDLFVDYEFKNDKKMFFGFNRSDTKSKDYNNNNNILDEESEDTINFYYLGFEIRGSFTGKNK